jgi:hypothetical protein
MKINESSWHFKLVNLAGEKPSDLCSYFWTLVRNTLIGMAVIPTVLVCLFMIYGIGWVTNEEIIQPKIVDPYFEVVTRVEYSVENGIEEKSNWRLKTADERRWYRLEQEDKESRTEKDNGAWFFILGICSFGLLMILGVSKTINYYDGALWIIGNSSRNKVLAFSIIPALINVMLGAAFAYYTNVTRWGIHSLDLPDIMMLPVLLLISWAFYQYIGMMLVRMIQEKNNETINLVTTFILAKKQKVCPMIDYTESV